MSNTVETNIPAINEMPEQHDMSAAGAQNAQLTANESQMIALTDIVLSDDLRFRKSDNEKKIAEYAEKFREYLDGEAANYPFDAVHVLQENGKNTLVAGRQRVKAAQKAGMTEIKCIVLIDRTKAIQIGLASNRHGLPLNNADKTHCIKIAVPALLGFSNRMIAELIGCSTPRSDCAPSTQFSSFLRFSTSPPTALQCLGVAFFNFFTVPRINIPSREAIFRYFPLAPTSDLLHAGQKSIKLGCV